MSTELEKMNKVEPEATERVWRRPRYAVREDAESFAVEVSLPGVNRAGVDISLEEDTLTIVGTRTETVPEGWRALRRELNTEDYRLSLRLNVAVNEAAIKAQVEHGVLTLRLPKADEVKARKIAID